MKRQITFIFSFICLMGLSMSLFATNGPGSGLDGKGELKAPYPNPAVNVAHLEYELPSMQFRGELQVYSLIGQLVKTVHLDMPMGETQIQTHDLKSGIYFVYLVSAGKKQQAFSCLELCARHCQATFMAAADCSMLQC